MPVPNISGVFKIVFEYGIDSWLGANVFHVVATPGADPQDVAQDVTDAWYETSSWRGLQSSSLTFGNITVQEYDGVSAGVAFPIGALQGNNDAGGGDADACPAQCALVLSLGTGLAGRSHRGRMFIGGLEGAQCNAHGTAWENPLDLAFAASVFKNGIENGSVTSNLTVYSPKLDEANIVTAVTARTSYIGTMRTRARDLQ